MSAATPANRELPRPGAAGLPEDLDALLALQTPAALLPTEHVAALPQAQSLPQAQPAKPAPQRRMKWIVTTLRALAAQQA
jgi:hypothetical protein